MKSLFSGHFANNTDDIEGLWGNCLFVMDANVLLSLYRFSDATKDELFKVFSLLEDRLWVPHQVAFEYLSNRLKVIGDQIKSYEDAKRNIDYLKESLENSNKAPFVSEEVLKGSMITFDKLISEFEAKKNLHSKRINDDDIKDQLERLFDNRVGPPFSREQLESYMAEGAQRYSEKIPPGFEDANKGGNSELFSEKCRPYGDLFVWKQIIEKARTGGFSVIFVTGDVKDDWWLRFQGKTVSPLPALVEEFEKETSCKFYMYTPHRFLERANQHFQQSTSQAAVEEIKSFEARESTERFARDVEAQNSALYPHGKYPVDKASIAAAHGELEGLSVRRVGLENELAILRRRYDQLKDWLLKEEHAGGDLEDNAWGNELFNISKRMSQLNKELDFVKHMADEAARKLSELKLSSEYFDLISYKKELRFRES